jgi:hypothetical protein
MGRRQWLLGSGIGVGVGVAVATIMTALDWRRNPVGIFHDAGATHWAVVLETGWSWFYPVAVLTAAAVWLAFGARALVTRSGARDG